MKFYIYKKKYKNLFFWYAESQSQVFRYENKSHADFYNFQFSL